MTNNPYVLLGIKETATDTEIRIALIKQTNLWCGGADDSRKNSDGEYLKEMFSKAAKDLLDSKRRKAIDESLARDREMYGIEKYTGKKEESSSQNKEAVKDSKAQIKQVEPLKQEEIVLGNTDRQNYIITLINRELTSNLQNINIDRNSVYGKKLPLNETLAVFGSDNSFMFANEKKRREFGYVYYIDEYGLYNAFTGNCFDNTWWCWEERPWREGKIFQINGIDSIAITASKFIPLDLIEYERIRATDLKKVNIAIQNYLIEHPEFIARIFPAKSSVHLEKK